MSQSKKLKFLGCEILYREACKLAAESANLVDVEFLPKGLHDLETDRMRAAIQERIDQAEADGDYQAILLGYARCNDGVVGLAAGSVPLVIPRAHDCITLFFGSRQAYQEWFDKAPGTYYMTTGWAERNDGWEFGASQIPGRSGIMQKLGLCETYEQMVARYGKDNADYILAELGDWKKNYTAMLYLEMGVCDESGHVEAAKARAAEHGWQFYRRPGSLSLLGKLFDGPWDDDFVLVQPGHLIRPRQGGQILASEPAGGEDQGD
ncbi:MAG: DUF1638 domain-containing protein [Phycisphaerae bacterium]